MKDNIVKTIRGMVLAVLLVSTLTPGLVSAQDESKNERLKGTWNVQVTIRDCQTDTALRTFASTTTFMGGGTLLDL